MMGMTKRGLIVFSLLMGIALSGCVVTGKPFSPVADIADDVAVIYVYRPYNLVGGSRLYTVLVDGREMGKLVNGAYQSFVVSPGNHKVDVKQDALLIKGYEYDVAVQLAAADSVYLRFGSEWAGGKAKLLKVDALKGKLEIEKCKKY